MNLQIDAQKLRFRISKQELEELCLRQKLVQQIFLPEQNTLNLNIIIKQQTPVLTLDFTKDSITLFVKKEKSEQLLNSLPSREGLKDKQLIDNQPHLDLLLEVDIRPKKTP